MVGQEPMQLATAMLTACHHGDMQAAAELMNSCNFRLLSEVLSCMTGIAVGFMLQLHQVDDLDIDQFLAHFGLTAAEE